MVYLHPSLKGKEFDFNGIIMVPHNLPDFPRSAVDLSSYVTRNIKVHVPFLGAAMDSVTEYKLAIMLELNGGIGVIHYNFPTVDDQIEQLKRVKNYKAAYVKNPVCLRPDNAVADVYKINEKYGFYSVPITEDGTPNSRLLGFVSRRDVRYKDDKSLKLNDVMTPREKLYTAHRRDTMDKNDIKAANAEIKKHNLDTLIVIDDEDRPCALVTDRDLRLHEQYPLASVDENKQLYGVIAIRGTWHDPKKREIEAERIDKAVQAGANCLVVDQGITFRSQIDMAKYIKEHYSDVEVGVGNVACGDMIKELLENAGKYIDMTKGGVGPGGACITQQDLGVGRDQPSTTYECVETLKQLRKKHGNIPYIADGGTKSAADINKLFALGADGVMMGQLFAAYDESAAEKKLINGSWKKIYRGMGSIEAMEAGGAIRYDIGDEKIRVPEGIVKQLEPLGPGEPFLQMLIESVKQSMCRQGFRNIKELQNDAWIYPYSGR